MRSFLSTSVFTFLVGFTIVVFTSTYLARIFLMRAEQDGQLDPNWGSYAGSILNAVAINLLSTIYNSLARALTDFEVQPT